MIVLIVRTGLPKHLCHLGGASLIPIECMIIKTTSEFFNGIPKKSCLKTCSQRCKLFSFFLVRHKHSYYCSRRCSRPSLLRIRTREQRASNCRPNLISSGFAACGDLYDPGFRQFNQMSGDILLSDSELVRKRRDCPRVPISHSINYCKSSPIRPLRYLDARTDNIILHAITSFSQ